MNQDYDIFLINVSIFVIRSLMLSIDLQDDKLTMEEFREGSRNDPRIVQVVVSSDLMIAKSLYIVNPLHSTTSFEYKIKLFAISRMEYFCLHEITLQQTLYLSKDQTRFQIIEYNQHLKFSLHRPQNMIIVTSYESQSTQQDDSSDDKTLKAQVVETI